MDKSLNPFEPGAGAMPPELAGRDSILKNIRESLDLLASENTAGHFLFWGLRGTGKTVLLNAIKKEAVAKGHRVFKVEAHAGCSLTKLLMPVMRKISGNSVIADTVGHNIGLSETVSLIAESDAKENSATVLLIDEMQHLRASDIAELINTLHGLDRKGTTVLLCGAGLPQVAGIISKAGFCPETTFGIHQIGALDEDSARRAICKPLEMAGVEIDEDALELVVRVTKGFPFLVQLFSCELWNIAQWRRLTKCDADGARVRTIQILDDGFFKARTANLSDKEIGFLTAMSELGTGPYAVGDIARQMNTTTRTIGHTRAGLIAKNLIHSQRRGFLDFSIPLFAEHLRRNKTGFGNTS